MPRPDKMVSPLKEIVEESHITQDPDKLKGYALDGKRPKVIVFPKTIEEVSKDCFLCQRAESNHYSNGKRDEDGNGWNPEKDGHCPFNRPAQSHHRF